MNVNIMLISPGPKYQDIIDKSLDLIEKSSINLNFQETANYSHKTSPILFRELFTIPMLANLNRKKVEGLKKLGITDPHAKYYDMVLILGSVDNETLMHLTLCMHQRIFNKLLIVDSECKDANALHNYIPPIVKLPDGSVIKSRIATTPKNEFDFRGIAVEIASMYLDSEEIKQFQNRIAA